VAPLGTLGKIGFPPGAAHRFPEETVKRNSINHHPILTTDGKALTLALIAPSFQRNAPGHSTVVEGNFRKD